MSVILLETHHKVVRNLKKKVKIAYFVGAFTVLLLISLPFIFKLQNDLLKEAYSVAKVQFDSILIKQTLLTVMRSKPMTVGQALDVVDVIMTQKDVPISIVLGMLEQESEFNPNAVSNKGARGLMQVMPATYKLYATHPLLQGQRSMHDPVMNMTAGLMFFGDMRKQFGDWKKALRAYFAGPENAENKRFDWYVNSVLNKASRYETVKEIH